MSEHMALENLTVLDLTRVLAGPFCTMMLADMGANVIKIEVPKGGDDTRSYPPFRAKNLNGERESVYFANINRNKKGITLNLKAPEGKEIFKELVKKADIVVENYRPGVMDKLGLGYDVLKEINPRIIYAAVSGFGCYGPYHLRPGYDILAQAMGGMMSITGSKGGEPTRAGSALGDILGGLHVTIGILAAVNARTITGKGQRVDVSLMDSMIAATENTALKYIETGNIPAPMGNRYAAVSPYDSFTCKGGKVIIAAGNQKLYEKLCNEVLERPDQGSDPQRGRRAGTGPRHPRRSHYEHQGDPGRSPCQGARDVRGDGSSHPGQGHRERLCHQTDGYQALCAHTRSPAGAEQPGYL